MEKTTRPPVTLKPGRLTRRNLLRSTAALAAAEQGLARAEVELPADFRRVVAVAREATLLEQGRDPRDEQLAARDR